MQKSINQSINQSITCLKRKQLHRARSLKFELRANFSLMMCSLIQKIHGFLLGNIFRKTNLLLFRQ